MIRPMLYAEDQELRSDFERGDIARVLADETSILWLDLEDPTPEDLLSRDLQLVTHSPRFRWRWRSG